MAGSGYAQKKKTGLLGDRSVDDEYVNTRHEFFARCSRYIDVMTLSLSLSVALRFPLSVLMICLAGGDGKRLLSLMRREAARCSYNGLWSAGIDHSSHSRPCRGAGYRVLADRELVVSGEFRGIGRNGHQQVRASGNIGPGKPESGWGQSRRRCGGGQRVVKAKQVPRARSLSAMSDHLAGADPQKKSGSRKTFRLRISKHVVSACTRNDPPRGCEQFGSTGQVSRPPEHVLLVNPAQSCNRPLEPQRLRQGLAECLFETHTTM